MLQGPQPSVLWSISTIFFTPRTTTPLCAIAIPLKEPVSCAMCRSTPFLTSTPHASGGPAARLGEERVGEDTSRSGRGLRPLHPCLGRREEARTPRAPARDCVPCTPAL